MKRLISIRRESTNESVLLNPDHIVAITTVSGGSLIYTTVQEEPRICKICTPMPMETLREIIDAACE